MLLYLSSFFRQLCKQWGKQSFVFSSPEAVYLLSSCGAILFFFGIMYLIITLLFALFWYCLLGEICDSLIAISCLQQNTAFAILSFPLILRNRDQTRMWIKQKALLFGEGSCRVSWILCEFTSFTSKQKYWSAPLNNECFLKVITSFIESILSPRVNP